MSNNNPDPNASVASVALGDHVRDPITKFEGTVTSLTDFLHGCRRCCVTAHALDKDGKELVIHFDVAQLEVVTPGLHAPKPRNYAQPPGGPERAVTSHPFGSPPRN